MSIYKQANRIKLRFFLLVGTLSIEQLWNVKEEDLVSYEEQLQELVEKGKTGSSRRKRIAKTKEQEENELRLAIVSDILNTREEEAEKATNARAIKAEEQELLDLLAEREKEEKRNLSKEEILAKLASLKK
jgi:predicted DsbA family dithiol-disulfide isomerase